MRIESIRIQADQNPLPPTPPPAQRSCLARTAQAFQRAAACVRDIDRRIDDSISNLYQADFFVGSLAGCLYLPTFMRQASEALNDTPAHRGIFFLTVIIYIGAIFEAGQLLNSSDQDTASILAV